MGKLHLGICGPFSGRVGNIIGYSSYGRNYVRSRPLAYRDAGSESQLKQRAGLVLVQDFARQLLPFIRIGFMGEASHTSPYNMAVSYNMRHALKGDQPHLQLDYSKAMVAMGSLQAAEEISAQMTGSNILEISWKHDKGLGSDDVMVVVYDPLKGLSHYCLQAARRWQQNAVITLPWQPGLLHLWVVCARLDSYFVNPDSKEISESRHIVIENGQSIIDS
jgi:hypothetical protein